MATYTNLDNEIFAQKVLEGFVAELLPFNAFSTNFSPDPVQKGNNVLVPLIGSITATTFNGSYAASGGTMSVITIAINQHRIARVGQDDLTAAGSSMANLEKFAYQQGAGLASIVLQDVFSLFVTGNISLATAVALAAVDVPQIRAGRLALNLANVPRLGRSLILDCLPYDNLLSITNFVQAHMFGDRAAIAEGKVPRALGFDLYELNTLFPVVGSTMGVFCGPAAVAVAMRYLQPQEGNSYRDARPITHPETGITLGLRDHYDNNTGSRYVNMECNFGYSLGITNAARILKRTDA